MKLATFQTPEGRTSYGIVRDAGLVDAGRRLAPRLPSLRAVLEQDALAELAALADAPLDWRATEIGWLPPLPEPPKLIMIGLNYKAHQKELGLPDPKNPVVIARWANSQIGHGAPVVRPTVSEQLDYEGELAVVIGRRGWQLSEQEALAHVAGYACYMDGTLRDFQKHSTQVGPAKSFPGTGAFGPWMVTRDEVADPGRLELTTRLNGEVVQRTSTADMIWSVAQLVAYLSTFFELQPGDVIATGTTNGVGSMRTPPRWLVPGDRIEVEIAGLGLLSNPVVAEAA